MILIIDGMRGSGKTSTILALKEILEGQGLKVKSLKPPRAEDAETNWVKLMQDAVTDEADIVIFDRGLGSEVLFSPSRGKGPNYQRKLSALDLLVKTMFEAIDQRLSPLELTFIVSREEQAKRGRTEWAEKAWDNEEAWTRWANNHSTALIDTTAAPMPLVLACVLDLIADFREDGKIGSDDDVEEEGDEDCQFCLISLLDKQNALMGKLGIDRKLPSSMLSACMGLICEAAEVLDQVNVFTRPWIEGAVNDEKFLEELVDVLFYWLEIAVLRGYTAKQLVEAYQKKWERNIRRAETRDDHVA